MTNILNVLIPSVRDTTRLNRLLDSLLLIEVPYRITLIRNKAKTKEPISIPKNCTTMHCYYQEGELGEVYRALWSTIKIDEHFIFLEDDDYLIDSIKEEDTQEDITLCGYRSDLPETKSSAYLDWQRTRRRYMIQGQLSVFEEQEKETNAFQLSCIIAKKKDIEMTWDNELSNDFLLFKLLLEQAKSIHYKRGALFMQTTSDNISFREFNKDKRWPMK